MAGIPSLYPQPHKPTSVKSCLNPNSAFFSTKPTSHSSDATPSDEKPREECVVVGIYAGVFSLLSVLGNRAISGIAPVTDARQISHQSALRSLSDGYSPHGDQIPWKFCEQFRDTVFPSLSGARIVRIATHPSAMRLGYGSKAVELLPRYFEGQLTSISETDDEYDVEEQRVRVVEAAEKVSLQEESIKPRTNFPPLFMHLRERRPEKLHYLGS